MVQYENDKNNIAAAFSVRTDKHFAKSQGTLDFSLKITSRRPKTKFPTFSRINLASFPESQMKMKIFFLVLLLLYVKKKASNRNKEKKNSSI